MNPDLVQLIELQQVEKEIAKLRAEIAALPKRVQAIEAKLADANQRVAKAQAAIKADEVARRKHESGNPGPQRAYLQASASNRSRSRPTTSTAP